jgi:hypothetical protein
MLVTYMLGILIKPSCTYCVCILLSGTLEALEGAQKITQTTILGNRATAAPWAS